MTVLVAAGALCGWGLTFLLERSLEPRPRLAGRPLAAHAVHLGIWLLLFGGLVLVVRRPLLAMVLAVLSWLPVVLVSNAKQRSLREPLVVTDLPFVSYAFRHPRLYVPFLSASQVALFSVATACVAVGAWFLVRFWPAPADWPGYLPLALALWTPAALLLWAGTRLSDPPTLDPAVDLQRWGLAASLWLYRRAEQRRVLVRPHSPFEPPAAMAAGSPLPDIVAVQSESFFDARRLFPGVRDDVLESFDASRREAVAEGRLRVPAWGANTVRTEFSFLSGLANESLGVDRLNPYRALAMLPVPTMASYLRDLGYRTICVHPYPATFYGRDRVVPALGFDEFVDLRSFGDAKRFGPYVSDASVADRIIGAVGESDRPAFVFAITMENHGPLHLETVVAGEATEYFSEAPEEASPIARDLAVYLRHLKNADRMLERLMSWMAGRLRPGVLCFYGDHVPIMPEVWAIAGASDGATDYVIWRSGRTAGGRRDHIPVERLGVMLLESAGVLGESLPTPAVPPGDQPLQSGGAPARAQPHEVDEPRDGHDGRFGQHHVYKQIQAVGHAEAEERPVQNRARLAGVAGGLHLENALGQVEEVDLEEIQPRDEQPQHRKRRAAESHAQAHRDSGQHEEVDDPVEQQVEVGAVGRAGVARPGQHAVCAVHDGRGLREAGAGQHRGVLASREEPGGDQAQRAGRVRQAVRRDPRRECRPRDERRQRAVHAVVDHAEPSHRPAGGRLQRLFVFERPVIGVSGCH